MSQDHASRSFSKQYPDTLTAAEVVRRSNVARQAGVITPKVLAVKKHTTIAFERIDGECGIGLVKSTDLSRLLSPLVKLHKIDQRQLPEFNPFLRIDPRMEELSIPSELLVEIRKLKQVAIPHNGVVHGDFHMGQLICDSADRCWVIDFDDMSLGPPEADLGNLIAYLGTHPATMGDSLSASLSYWQRQIEAAWNELGQVYEDERLQYFMQVALIRRSLKRCEAGDCSLVRDCISVLLASG